jgi:hypothetical protein
MANFFIANVPEIFNSNATGNLKVSALSNAIFDGKTVAIGNLSNTAIDVVSAGNIDLEGAKVILQGSNEVNIYSPFYNLYYPGAQGGQLTIDSNSQLSYATIGVGLSVGVSGAIPLIQYGKVTLSNSSSSNTVSLPISYQANTSYVTHITLNSNVPESGLDFSVDNSDSNYFTVYQTASVGSNDHSYFWTTTGEYPPGPPT